jgi:hypothetical protein
MHFFETTVNSRFKKDLKLQIHLHKAFFSDDRFLDSLHKSFLNQTTLDLRKEKWTFLNRDFTVLIKIKSYTVNLHGYTSPIQTTGMPVYDQF